MSAIKQILILAIPAVIIYAETLPPTAKQCHQIKDKRVECRWICDQKKYKEKKIAEAVSYYKTSKYYKFSSKRKEF